MTIAKTVDTPDGIGVHLLLLLEALVGGDPRPAGLEAVVGLGVRHPTGETWWRARFTARQAGAETTFSESAPSDCDVRILLGEREATGFMRTGRFPADSTTIECQGDVRLFRQMTDHYTQTQSATSLRASKTQLSLRGSSRRSS